MCITIRVAELTMDRRRSGRDIRLSTATMRALNSQRPRSITSIHRLVSCKTLCLLLLLLCVFHDARARSVSHDDGDVIADQVQDKISESAAEVSDPKSDGLENADQVRRKSLIETEGYDSDEDISDKDQKNSAVKILVEDLEKIQVEAAGDEGSVAKKRRRNDVILPGKSVLQDKEENVQKDEGIRRFDAQIESDDVEEPGQQKIFDVIKDVPDLQRDVVEHEKRLINVEQSHVDVKNENAKSKGEEEGAEQEEKQYIEISSDLRENLENVASLQQAEKLDLNKEKTEQIENLAKHNLDEVRIENVDGVNEEIRNDLRSLKLVQANESKKNQEQDVVDETLNNEKIGIKDLDPNREDRHLTNASAKSKYKSSTVYLNAEERNSPGREQESIVNGQIKKLISIRDDALESIDNDTKQSEKIDQESLLAEKSIEIDVATVEKDREIRNQRSSELKNIIENKSLQDENVDQLSPTMENPSRLQKWKIQATLLQEQIKNRTFLQYLREQATEVLSDIPKFTENQLLETLKNIALFRTSPSNETYVASLNTTELNTNQLEIIKCTEQLIETKQRQSFVANMAECIRGLSVFNCIQIFVWPVVLDNLPESVGQSLNNLPIEINLIDLFQGNRTKSARSESSIHHPRLLTPESVVFSILSGALESKVTYDQAPTYIDPKNETLRRLLTIGQLQILQMAEKLLPGEIRREYSDQMFSCVRRFEYFSCIKYFAWPMVKQYYPALPAFPDYQSWYPTFALYPQYPIVPFPSFIETSGELPEVIDADATRMRQPQPEAVIINILQNTLKEHAKTPFPSVIHNADSYVAILSPEQLLSIRMAEQLIPISYRSEFVQKTMKCIQELNYMTCIKYSTWPTIKQLYPTVPNISDWLPNWFPGVFSFLPDFQLPHLPDFSQFIPGFGSGGDTSTEQPSESSDSTPDASIGRYPPILLRQKEISSKTSNELENKVTEILTGVHNSLRTIPENSHLIVGGNVIILTTITEKQINILKLAESIVPPVARAPLVTQVISCLQTNNEFINCTRYVIWPTISLYVSNFPEFPDLPPKQQPPKQEDQTSLKDKNALHLNIKNQQELNKSQNEANSNVKIISRTKLPQNNSPVISVTGTRFVPIFTEHPESVILNILRSIQLSSPNVRDNDQFKLASTMQLADLLNDRQLNIVSSTEGLLPDAVRPAFVDRMRECIHNNNFLSCSRNVLWPALSEYFPRLPSFPDFGAHPQATNIKSTLSQNLTDSSPFSETDVKIGQHGDATVTITDTRFYPVFSEHPEGVILKILKAVQSSIPGVVYSTTSRLPETMSYFTEQQANIIHVAENLLPESMRLVFIERMVNCIRENTFLDCTRDVTWPTVAQFFPRLPNFPDFGNQNIPRAKLDSPSILLHNTYSENARSDENASKIAIEDQIESTLKELLNKNSVLRVENSYLDVNNPVINNLLTAREMNIVRLTEKAIPDLIRPAYITNMLECMRSNNFITCTQQITWPTLKQFSQVLPNFEDLFGQLQIPGMSQIPGASQIPGISQFPGVSQIPGISLFPDASQIPGLGQLPGTDQIPGGGQIPGFPGLGNPFAEGLPQFPSQISMIPSGIPAGIPQFPGLPNFGSINYPQFTILPDTAQKLKSQEQTFVQSTIIDKEKASQISGVSRAANTPSVDEQGNIPGYLGQPTDILIDISKEKIYLSDIEQNPLSKFASVDSFKKHKRRRRNADGLLNSYYEIDQETEPISNMAINNTFPNITESEFLQLLINISNCKRTLKNKPAENPKEYFVDTLNSTIKNSLTADQYEILKMVEDFDEHTANRGFLSQVAQCLISLSFIRCVGIFVWPMIINAVPSLIGLPSLPSLPSVPGLGFLGRSTEIEVERFFGMSTNNFEKELLMRKESVENILLDWYKKAIEDQFQTNLGFLTIKGYGNGELGISFSGFREGRATKIKDNKNLPSILTIISDIMEEVLDQRPDNEKINKEKEKRERSLDDVQETNFQFLKDSDEYADIKRSINDDQIITMFLDKIKANATDFADGNVAHFLNTEDAYSAFGELFGTRLNEKFANRLKLFTEEHLKKNKPENQDATELSAEELKVIPLKEELSYDLEKESTENHEERKREHRAKNEFKSLFDKYSDKFVKKLDISTEKIEDLDNENKIKITETYSDRNTRSELRIQLPRLREDIVSRKITNAVIHLGRALKMKMSTMMPGIGFIISFLVQTALAHAKAAASIAGMISNMALVSAMFGMLRQNLFGSENQKIKYVYDNDKTGPGIIWPHHHRFYHHGK